MIDFKTIKYFRQRLLALKSVRRGVYATVEDEIRREFADKPIEEIRINNDMVLIDADSVVIKLRLPEKNINLQGKMGTG